MVYPTNPQNNCSFDKIKVIAKLIILHWVSQGQGDLSTHLWTLEILQNLKTQNYSLNL